jgi:hypothetical protein
LGNIAATNPRQGQSLTDQLPHLNTVEIDNSIAPHAECQLLDANNSSLRVIEFNAERGRWWLESAHLLRDYDVIILNEMDIGMARSDQQHTTRLLANYLGMNYAWGLEFVELTNGNQDDRDVTAGYSNDYGLHGNAFLTRCEISDPLIFRDKVGLYFSNKQIGLNAGGLEKRLGGRMGMFGRIVVNGKSLVIGSVHKIGGSQKEIYNYIGSSPAIVAGDQNPQFCGQVGLQPIVSSKQHYTWPATCTGNGRGRGDNLCSNLPMVETEKTISPCIREYGQQWVVSDHALTWTGLGI